MLFRIFCMISFLLVAGCAFVENRVPINSPPIEAASYFAGDFELAKNPFSTALVLKNGDSGKEYIFSFTNKHGFENGNKEFGIVQVPPGTYFINEWLVFNSFWGPGLLQGLEFKSKIPEGKLRGPFEIKGGEIIFIGKFYASSEWTPGYTSSTTEGNLKAIPITYDQAKSVLTEKYPKFSTLKIICVLCVD